MTEEKQNNKKKEELSIDDQIDEIKKKANARIKRLQEKKTKQNMLLYEERLKKLSKLTNQNLVTCSDDDFERAFSFLKNRVYPKKKQ